MDKKITTIKHRMLQVSKKQKIAYEKFFKEIGTTYASFKGDQLHSSVKSHTIDSLITKYPKINLHWLFTGEGEMETSTVQSNTQLIAEPIAKFGETPKSIIDKLHLENNTAGSIQASLFHDLYKQLEETKAQHEKLKSYTFKAIALIQDSLEGMEADKVRESLMKAKEEIQKTG